MNWAERFERFFVERQDDLALVLTAQSCREGWVHGEMHLAFSRQHPGFGIAKEQVAKGLFTDAACSTDPKMICEVKVLGSGVTDRSGTSLRYQTKCVSGGSLRKVQPFLGQKIGSRHRSGVCLGPWGLIPDYFRLRDARRYRSWERLLVLVADVQEGDSGLLPDTLRRIDFEGVETKVLLNRGFVRIWTLP